MNANVSLTLHYNQVNIYTKIPWVWRRQSRL